MLVPIRSPPFEHQVKTALHRQSTNCHHELPIHSELNSISLNYKLLRHLLFQPKHSDEAPLTQLKHGIQNHCCKERDAKNRWAIFVVIFYSLALSDTLASVEVNANGVEEREDRNEREGACSHEGDASRLGPEVKQSSRNGADIYGEFELQSVSFKEKVV